MSDPKVTTHGIAPDSHGRESSGPGSPGPGSPGPKPPEPTPPGPELPAPEHIAFVLLPGYSFIALSAAVEPLRMANRLSPTPIYRWSLLSLDEQQTQASNGLVVTPQASITSVTEPGPDAVFLCGGEDVQRHHSKRLVGWLKKLARRKVPLGALCTASHVLAREGLLDGYRCTIHWENIASMREQFPACKVTAALFEIDRDRYTASGGTAPMDLMLQLINERHGGHLAVAISEGFVCDRIRGANDSQRIPLRMHLGTSQPKLVEAVSLMEANLEEPMSLDELARHVVLSRRQLERLFQKHLNCVPTRYYLELRLARARQLLLQTSMSVVDVAFACGFVSAPHFSKCYRDYYGLPPRDERLRRNPGDKRTGDAKGRSSRG